MSEDVQGQYETLPVPRSGVDHVEVKFHLLHIKLGLHRRDLLLVGFVFGRPQADDAHVQ